MHFLSFTRWESRMYIVGRYACVDAPLCAVSTVANTLSDWMIICYVRDRLMVNWIKYWVNIGDNIVLRWHYGGNLVQFIVVGMCIDWFACIGGSWYKCRMYFIPPLQECVLMDECIHYISRMCEVGYCDDLYEYTSSTNGIRSLRCWYMTYCWLIYWVKVEASNAVIFVCN